MWWLFIIGVLGVGLLCVAYGVLIEHTWFRLRRLRLDILPAEGPESLTILHISDPHMVASDEKKVRFLASLPEADITIVTGDFLAEPQAVDNAVRGVEPTRGRLASYFVLGSNDHFVATPINYFRYFRSEHKRHAAERGPVLDLIQQLHADGWEDLSNRHVDALLGEGVGGDIELEIAGLDDPHIHRSDLRVAQRQHPERFGLAVAHAPDPAPELIALGYDLVVVGHTHGGQVRLPLTGALVNNSLLPRRFSRGLIRIGPGFLHISAGLGTSKFAPFRFWCRPEATLLTLGRGPS